MTFTFLLLLSLVSSSIQLPAHQNEQKCKSFDNMLSAMGMDIEDYDRIVAHGIHSLYLEDIREIFEPNALENNGLPVLNYDLRAENPIWPNSPLVGYDDSLKSYAFKTMDFVFSHDSPDFMLNKATTVEKLGHAFHMQQTWLLAKEHYIQFKENPLANAEEICACSNDVQSNGVIEMLKMAAQALATYPSQEIPTILMDWVPNFHTWSSKMAKKTRMQELPKENKKIFKKQTEQEAKYWTPGEVSGYEGWQQFKVMLQKGLINDDQNKALGLFIYCKLNHQN